MAELQKLKAIRARCKGTITRIEPFVIEQTNKVLIDGKPTTYEKFTKVQLDISCSQKDEDDLSAVQDEFDEKYFYMLAQIEKLLMNSRASEANWLKTTKVENRFASK